MFASPFEIATVGVMFEGRQELLADLYAEQERGAPLTGRLEREPGNAYDPNAIKVVVMLPAGRADHVGYVPRALAAKLGPRLDAGEDPRVISVRIIRGEHEHRVTYGARVVVEMRPLFAGEGP